MQADAIPDWAIYILFTPFIPLAGFVHYGLGVAQCTLIIAAWVRVVVGRRVDEMRLSFFRSVYLPFSLLPNVAVVIWGVVTDPAL